jgi:hypothetical protein
MHNSFVKNCSFFKNMSRGLIGNLIPLLLPLKIKKGEIIYRKDDYPNQGINIL